MVVDSCKKQSQTVGTDFEDRAGRYDFCGVNGRYHRQAHRRGDGKVNKEGVITVEEAKETRNPTTVVEGMQFDRGYISAIFITDTQKMERSWTNPYLLITDKISMMKELMGVLEPGVKIFLYMYSSKDLHRLNTSLEKSMIQIKFRKTMFLGLAGYSFQLSK